MMKYVYDHFGMAIFAEAGLVLFVWVFVTTFIHAARRPKAEIARLASMALESDVAAPPGKAVPRLDAPFGEAGAREQEQQI